jgi:hypothetical protein
MGFLKKLSRGKMEEDVKGGFTAPGNRREFRDQVAVGLTFVFLAVLLRNYFVAAAVLAYFVIFADSFLRERQPAQRHANFRLAMAGVLFLVIILPLASLLEGAARPTTMDGRFRVVDLKLGLDGFALSRFCLGHSWAYWLTVVIYDALPLALALVWIISRSPMLVRGAIAGALAALPCYLVLPAAGPRYAFHGWPLPGAQLIAEVSEAHARNCMPSMHFTWALLAASNVRGRWSAPFMIYAVLMGLATVAIGEHYFVDVIAAVPFAFVVQWAAGQMPAWWARLRELDHLRAVTVGQLARARGVDGAAVPRESETLV